MNPERLRKLQNEVRIGGKGSQRRKRKVVHKTSTIDDKKLQSSLKKVGANIISNVEEVNMMKDDGSVIHFTNPRVQASLAANTFAITGHAENKQLTEMLPGILNQLGPDGLKNLRKFADRGSQGESTGSDDADSDKVPNLEGNFDDQSKYEGNSTATIK